MTEVVGEAKAMQPLRIGSLDVSPIGLGCMNLSFGYGAADDAASIKLLNTALDLGVTFFDTAMMYGDGHNETLIGQALESRRGEFTLATKCGLSPAGIDGNPTRIAGDCDASLERLGTDVIDLYYLHRVDPAVPVEETVGAMSRLVDAGKVREIGLSEVCVETLEKALTSHPIAAVQSEYSLWSRTPEFGMLEACRERDIAFVPFSPLGRGFLAGSARSVERLPVDDLRATIARPRFEPDAFVANSLLLERFAITAKETGCSLSQLALAWLMADDSIVTVPIPGTRRLEHLRDNVASVDVVTDAITRASLDALFAEHRVVGTRYTADRMASADAERDRDPKT